MRELSLHVLDLVQNSLEAGATWVKILIKECIEEDLLLLSVTDNGRGMDQATVNYAKNPFCTSRKTRRVGLGLALLDMVTSQCNGSLKIQSEIGKGTIVEAKFQHSHWDRPPLGDIVNTVLVLITANSSVNLDFCHCIDAASFRLATCDIKKILGEVLLTQPEVLDWLKQYIEQNEKMLYGGKSI